MSYASHPAASAPYPGQPFASAAPHPDKPLRGASFGQAIKRFFQGYVRFSGRASQSELWWAMLFGFLVTLPGLVVIVLAFVPVIAFATQASASPNSLDESQIAGVIAASFGLQLLGYGLIMIPALGLLLPLLAVTWRRFQDANLPGPLALISLVISITPYIAGFLPPNPAGVRFDRDAEGLAAQQAYAMQQAQAQYGAQPGYGQPQGPQAPYGQQPPYGG